MDWTTARSRGPIDRSRSALAIAAAVMMLATGVVAQTPRPAELLERLQAEERARERARAESEAEEEARGAAREHEMEESRRREEREAAEAARALERRREAMREWHTSFAATLGPVLAARGRLYGRIPHRMFARVRPECEEVARAVDAAAARYRPAPERVVEALARDLLAVYRDSARLCASGAYFSFTVAEGRIRELVSELITTLEPFGLGFPLSPRAAAGAVGAPSGAAGVGTEP